MLLMSPCLWLSPAACTPVRVPPWLLNGVMETVQHGLCKPAWVFTGGDTMNFTYLSFSYLTYEMGIK